MNIKIITPYYPPEFGACSRRMQVLAEELAKFGHKIDVVCPLPNYPYGKIFDGYRNKIFKKEKIAGLQIRRYFIFASNSKNAIIRNLSILSFAINFFWEIPSTLLKKTDIFIIQTPPLLMGFVAVFIAKIICRKKIILNVADIWPLTMLELGVMKKGNVYSFFQAIEKFMYKKSDFLLGQSEEIIEYVNNTNPIKSFLYRNLSKKRGTPKIIEYPVGRPKLIYAGVLGFAQGVASICKNIDFKELGIEFHIYGSGNEKTEIVSYINQNQGSNIFFHGSVPHNEMINIIPKYQYSLIPLAEKITGAVPSKIYEMASMGIPIIFCGCGEAAMLINKYQLGWTSKPNDYKSLKKNLLELRSYSEEDYQNIRNNCLMMSEKFFNLELQINNFEKFISDRSNYSSN